MKKWLVFIGLAAVIAVVWALTRPSPPPASTTPSRSDSPQAAPRKTISPVRRAPESAHRSRPATEKGEKGASSKPALPRTTRPTVLFERDVFSEAERKLREGDASSAVALLAELLAKQTALRHHEAVLALYIEALLKAGQRDEAHTQLKAFKRRYPQSRHLLKNGNLKAR